MLNALIAILLSLAPIDRQTATIHVQAAMAAEEVTGIEAELLLAIAYVESRYIPRALSRLECRPKKKCRRVTGIWTSDHPPENARAPFYCGVLQTGGRITWEKCRAIMDDIPGSYLAAAGHLLDWMRVPQCRTASDKITCALKGYGGGYIAIQRGSRYPKRVLDVVSYIKDKLPTA